MLERNIGGAEHTGWFWGNMWTKYRDANKSLAHPTSRCILFDGENISFDASLVIYVVYKYH
jgi:hypothetical protein